MDYYVIRPSRDIKAIGHYPQTKSVKQNCDVWNEPKFIEHIHFQKIDFEPITANAVLFDSSKITDVIDVVGMGFTKKLLISGKLKSLLESYRKTGLQFFASDVVYKTKYIKDYWVLNVYEIDMEFIDFKHSKIALRKKRPEGGTYLENVEIKSLSNFYEELGKKKGQLLIEKIMIAENISQDFFTLLHVEGGVKYIVSEELKSKIEAIGCTGIEFMPVELKLSEWLLGGERERVYGKA